MNNGRELVWLIGNKGMLGSDVETLLEAKAIDHIGTDREVDITDLQELLNFTRNKRIAWIVNCAAYTDVDQAEVEVESAMALNASGAGNVAETARQIGAQLIHLSTDYVFPGNINRPLREDDTIAPASVYGKSKAQGERLIQEKLQEYFIVRTAWLYGKNGNNFVYTMLRLFEEKTEISVVNDQWGNPTCTKDLAAVIVYLISADSRTYGVYHVSGSGRISWFDFAKRIYAISSELYIRKSDCRIKPIGTKDYQTRAIRPIYSDLSKEKIERELGLSMPEWHVSLGQFLTELFLR